MTEEINIPCRLHVLISYGYFKPYDRGHAVIASLNNEQKKITDFIIGDPKLPENKPYGFYKNFNQSFNFFCHDTLKSKLYFKICEESSSNVITSDLVINTSDFKSVDRKKNFFFFDMSNGREELGVNIQIIAYPRTPLLCLFQVVRIDELKKLGLILRKTPNPYVRVEYIQVQDDQIKSRGRATHTSNHQKQKQKKKVHEKRGGNSKDIICTEVQEHNKHPKWDKNYAFYVRYPEYESFSFQIWNKGEKEDEIIGGTVKYALNKIDVIDFDKNELSLRDSPEIRLESFKENGKTAGVIIVKLKMFQCEPIGISGTLCRMNKERNFAREVTMVISCRNQTLAKNVPFKSAISQNLEWNQDFVVRSMIPTLDKVKFRLKSNHQKEGDLFIDIDKLPEEEPVQRIYTNDAGHEILLSLCKFNFRPMKLHVKVCWAEKNNNLFNHVQMCITDACGEKNIVKTEKKSCTSGASWYEEFDMLVTYPLAQKLVIALMKDDTVWNKETIDTCLFKIGQPKKPMRINFKKLNESVNVHFEVQAIDYFRKVGSVRALDYYDQFGKYFNHDEIDGLVQLFNVMDADNGGTISIDEVKLPFLKYNLGCTAEYLENEFVSVDKDGNGDLEFHEFINFFVKEKDSKVDSPIGCGLRNLAILLQIEHFIKKAANDKEKFRQAEEARLKAQQLEDERRKAEREEEKRELAARLERERLEKEQEEKMKQEADEAQRRLLEEEQRRAIENMERIQAEKRRIAQEELEFMRKKAEEAELQRKMLEEEARRKADEQLRLILESEKYDKEIVFSYANFLNFIFEEKTIDGISSGIPINPKDASLFDVCENGVLYCEIVNEISKGEIEFINRNPITNSEKIKNYNLSIQSLVALGFSIEGIQADELKDKNKMNNISYLRVLIECYLKSKINPNKYHDLMMYKNPKENDHVFIGKPVSELLGHWVKDQNNRSGGSCATENFEEICEDFEVIANVLLTIAPGVIENVNFLADSDKNSKAEKICETLKSFLGYEFIVANQMIEGKSDAMLLVIAALFLKNPNLFNPKNTIKYDDSIFDIKENNRELMQYTQWLNSKGINPPIFNILNRLSDGFTLLKIMEMLNPGFKIDKTKVKEGGMVFQKNLNYDYAVENKDLFNMKLTGISGADIVNMNPKSVLTVLWQLMDYDIKTQFKSLSNQNSNVNANIKDTDIIEWANKKTKRVGISIKTFADPSITDSNPILELIDSIISGSVDRELISNADNIMKAKYVISIIRSLGKTVFALPEDITERNPKMIMTIYATLMLYDIGNNEDNYDEYEESSSYFDL